MKILTNSIIPSLCIVSLALLSQASGTGVPTASQTNTNSNGRTYVVGGSEMVGSPTDPTSFGIFFTGTANNGNSLTNYGTIVTGTGHYSGVNVGVYLYARDGAEANGNVISNFGTINTVSSTAATGVMFDAFFDGDALNNLVQNFGSIQVVATGSAAGIAFLSEGAMSANGNVVHNQGTISVTSGAQSAYGIGFDGQNYGDASGNTVFNNGVIQVSSPLAAYGIAFTGWGYGTVNNNNVINQGSILVSSSSQAFGIYFNGGAGGSASNNTVINEGNIVVTGNSAVGIGFDGSSVLNGTNVIYGNASSNTITNWGTIIASGSNSAAILITNGNNNVITLAGHSSVLGDISASGTNNVLNLAFTGVSKKAADQIRAELGAEALSGSASSRSFTVRGVTYVYDPLIISLSTSSYEAQGRTLNQKAVGANLDSFKTNPTGDMLTLLNALDQSGNVARGLEQLSPQRYQIYADIALANADVLTQEIDQRLNNLRSGSESIDTTGLSISSGCAQSKLGMGDHKQVIGTGKDSKAPVEQTQEKRWGAFLSGDVVFADVNGRGGQQQDSNFTNSGLVGGVDAKITDALTTGVLFGYSHSDVDMDSQNSNANVDAYSAGLYSGYHEGNFYGNGLATFTRNIYESDRNIAIPGASRTANGRTAGSQYMVNLDGGYDHPVCKDLTVGPFAGLQYVHMDVNSFTENGAGAANLAINDQAMDSLRSRLGVRMELRKEINAYWTAASEVRVAWMHEFANNDRAIVARFSGSGLGSFAVRTDDPERNAALIGLGFNATYRDTLTTFVDYDVQVGQSHYTEQILKGGFKWSF